MIEFIRSFILAIDRLNLKVGQKVRWLVLVIPFVVVLHGTSRRLFSLASNHVSEAQWYMFSAIFMIGAGYTLLRDEHVRIDLFSQRFPDKLRHGIEAAFHLLLLCPICVYLIVKTGAMFWFSMLVNEGPPDVVVGLPRWILISFMPIGFTLLGLQCLSEGLKRLLAIAGHGDGLDQARGLFAHD